MGSQHEEPEHIGFKVQRDVPHVEEVALALAHLPVVDVYMPVVQPVVRKIHACRGFALSYLVLVMRENQVDSARVNVERLAQYVHAHCGALYMPAGTTLAPG